jgi:bifunctional UDP-N-acetylglucosamine pyrophosphorylase/glucosamine-1-phosphate N-acetyltransferase
MKSLGAVILAAGAGTRLNEGKPSPKPKVLYEVLGKPLILYSLEVLRKVGVEDVILVVGQLGDQVKEVVGGEYKYALQKDPLGTGNATLKGIDKLSDKVDTVMVIYGADIYSEEILRGAINNHLEERPPVTFVTKIIDDPTGYGRIIRDESGKVIAIVEEKVATDKQKQINEVNDGCFIFERKWLEDNINSLALSKANEYFLTDLVEIAMKSRFKVATYTITNPFDWIGVDSPEDIKYAERILRGRI